MQINRLFEMIYLLLGKKSMTAQELADHFEVSKRTILRDIETLSSAKIPIYTTQGKGGGVSLMDGFVLNKAALTEEEQDQILLALQSLGVAKHAGAESALAKLGALFQKQRSAWIEVDFSRWGQSSLDNAKFGLLKEAILGEVAVGFEYVGAASGGDASPRRVYPLKLVFKSKAWYLQGFCTDKNDYRTFKLNRMLNVSKTNENFDATRYHAPPIEPPLSTLAGLCEIELVFSPRVAFRVYDEFDEGAIERADDGTLHVLALMPEDEWLYSFLLSLGQDVEVLCPLHVKEKLLKMHHIP